MATLLTLPLEVLEPLLRAAWQPVAQKVATIEDATSDDHTLLWGMGAALRKLSPPPSLSPSPKPGIYRVPPPATPMGPSLRPTGPVAPHPAAVALLLLVGAAELYQSRPDVSEEDLDRELHDLTERERELRRQMTGDVWLWDPNALIRKGHALLETQQLIRQVQLEKERQVLEQKKLGCRPHSTEWVKITQRLTQLENEMGAIPQQTLGTAKLWDTMMASADDAPPATSADVSGKKEGEAKQLAKDFDRRLLDIRLAVRAQLDAKRTAPEILLWFKETLIPEINQAQAQMVAASYNQVTRDIFHDVKTRYVAFRSGMELNLQAGRLEDVRRQCEPHNGRLQGMIGELQVDFSTTTKIRYNGPRHIAVSPLVDHRVVMGMLQNLVSNGGEHPRKPGDLTPITFSLEIRAGEKVWLVYNDKGAGATRRAVDMINRGVRLHNDQEVDDNDPVAREHGFGWRHIRAAWQSLGIEGESDARRGQGFTTVMELPPGFLEPDVASYIASGSQDFDELQILIDQMTPERRLLVVRDMANYISHAIADLLTKLQETPTDQHPQLRARAESLLSRYEKIKVLYFVVPITGDNAALFASVIQVERYAVLLKTLMENIE